MRRGREWRGGRGRERGDGGEGERGAATSLYHYRYTITTYMYTLWQRTSELPGLQIMMSKQNILVVRVCYFETIIREALILVLKMSTAYPLLQKF